MALNEASMCACTRVRARVRARVRVYVRVCTRVRACVRVCARVCACVRVYVRVCTRVRTVRIRPVLGLFWACFGPLHMFTSLKQANTVLDISVQCGTGARATMPKTMFLHLVFRNVKTSYWSSVFYVLFRGVLRPLIRFHENRF
jgi:hypothetical protein